MSKHTPAPWRYVEGFVAEKKTYDFWVRDANNRGICKMHTMNEANARLIASAPELLEALKELLVFYEGIVEEEYGKYYSSNCADKARKAIAKAEDK